MHLLRQLEPSWLRRGQTTSLLESVIEKDDVKDDRGGILTPPYVMACWRGGYYSDKRLRSEIRDDSDEAELSTRRSIGDNEAMQKP